MSSDALKARYADLLYGQQPPAPVTDPVVLESGLTSALVNKLDLNGDASVTQAKIVDAGAVARSFRSILRDTVSIMQFGAIGDGLSHPLSGRYATLAAAQADFPFVTSLTQESDAVALQAALNTGKIIDMPDGSYRIDTVTLSTTQGGIRGRGRGRTKILLITPAGQDAILFTGNATPDFQAADGSGNPITGRWNFGISGVTIDGSLTTGMTGWVLNATNCAGLVISDVLFRKVSNFTKLTNCYWTAAFDISGFDLAFGSGNGFYINGGSFVGDRLFYESSTPGGYNMEAEAFIKVAQTYGVFLGTGIVGHIRRGLYVCPGANQFCEYSAVGSIQFDQCSIAGVELFANGGVIRGWSFYGTWAATAGNGWYMHVANSGAIYRPELYGCRGLNSLNTNLTANDVTELKIIGGNFSGAGYVFTGTCSTSSIDNSVTVASGFSFNTVMAGQTITINGTNYTIQSIATNQKAILTTNPGTQSAVTCSFTSNTQTNIAIGGSSISPSIVGVTAKADLYSPGTPGVGIFLDANVDKPILSNNDVTGVPNAIVSNRSSAWTEAYIAGNRGANTAYPTIASASTLSMGFSDVFTMTGSANITAFSGPAYPGMRKKIIPTGNPTFTAGNNVGNNYTGSPLLPFDATFAEGRWFLE